jgi:hypothetical protein
MSEPGLYTLLYVQLRHCGELIDQVIVDFETTGGRAGLKQREDLAQLLRVLQTSPASDLDATLLANVLRETKAASGANWAEVADAIDQGDLSEGILERLEELARALEVQRADMHARIHSAYAR